MGTYRWTKRLHQWTKSMLSPVEIAIQFVVFLLGVAWLFTCAVPLALGTIEWVFNIGGTRTRR